MCSGQTPLLKELMMRGSHNTHNSPEPVLAPFSGQFWSNDSGDFGARPQNYSHNALMLAILLRQAGFGFSIPRD